MVADLEASVGVFESECCPAISSLQIGAGDAVFMETTERFGHYTELDSAHPLILSLDAQNARAAVGFEGTDPVRPLRLQSQVRVALTGRTSRCLRARLSQQNTPV
jgi:hypothetical protein